ncbi:helix-turn-helix domain-containing protein [Acidaminobacter sp. JC074]|uniref:helix-turn-helix domain-containing protein n=1 Tax=Acidaminobacter sp. JC074 TaxID=2530199 RepID=UPI001F0E5B41|nr:helix-turn-helix domain-containing protein [Acidaminobacter sp. JC074]
MNLNTISKNLVILRQTKNITQDDLSKILNVSRQAISKWERGISLPNIETLLELSKIYNVTINEILESQSDSLKNFEDICLIESNIITKVVSSIPPEDVVIALMGASPSVNELIKNLYPDIDYKKEREKQGFVKITEVEVKQNKIIKEVNFQLRKHRFNPSF